MTYEINETHDPNLKSWVESANDPNTDFPIQNLPVCCFSSSKRKIWRHVGVVIGSSVLDMDGAVRTGAFDPLSYKGTHLLGDGLPLETFFDEVDFSIRKELRELMSSLLSESQSDEIKESLAKHLYAVKNSHSLTS